MCNSTKVSVLKKESNIDHCHLSSRLGGTRLRRENLVPPIPAMAGRREEHLCVCVCKVLSGGSKRVIIFTIQMEQLAPRWLPEYNAAIT